MPQVSEIYNLTTCLKKANVHQERIIEEITQNLIKCVNSYIDRVVNNTAVRVEFSSTYIKILVHLDINLSTYIVRTL